MNILNDPLISRDSLTIHTDSDDPLEEGEIRTPKSINKSSSKRKPQGGRMTRYNVCYESPLTHLGAKAKIRLSESRNDSVIILDTPFRNKNGRSSKKLRKSLDAAGHSACPDDSVIILSDSEIESNKKNKIKQSNDREIPISNDDSVLNSDNVDVIVVDYKPAIKKFEINKEQKPKVLQPDDKSKVIPTSYKTKSGSGNVQMAEEVSLISNLSIGATKSPPISIDSEDDENTEPPRSEADEVAPVQPDDVAVVWMSLHDDNTPCVKSRHAARASDAFTNTVHVPPRPKTMKGSLPIIMDTKGDFSNLHRLDTKSKNINKKQQNNKTGRQNPNWAAFSNNNDPNSARRNEPRTEGELPLSQPTLNDNLTIYTTERVEKPPGSLREIVIDGCNIAMAHTNGRVFSETGLKLVIDYFKMRGHTVKAFVPQHKRSLQHKLLEKLYSDGIVVFTPSRNIGGRQITPYDDRFILAYATLCGGIVISLDQYRDLYKEKPEWRDTIENRLLAPTFVGNYVMFPEDPLGKRGPKLERFLRH